MTAKSQSHNSKTSLYSLLAVAFVLLSSGVMQAQTLVTNNGALVAIKPGAEVIVKTGTFDNDAGTVDNAGRLIIEEDFINSDTANGGNTTGKYEVQRHWENNGIFIADSSTVDLYGANQLITGTSITEFHNLTLLGTGIKTQTIDARVNSILSLNDRELATDTNKMFVLNTLVGAITKTPGPLGFVSSEGPGRLVREMAAPDVYVFPVGSSVGTARYRPVEVEPASSLNQTVEVRMANVDATTEGFNRNVREPDICDINPLYYHLVDRTQGTDPVDLKFFYDPAADGEWDIIAHWQNTPRWEEPAQAFTGVTPPFNTLEFANWNFPSSFPAYGFAILNPDIDSAATVLTDPTCFNGNDGAIDITVDQGSSPYTYDWNPAGNTQDLNNITAGNYTVTITDDNGCSRSYSFDIENPEEILLSLTPADVSCAGGSDGDISLNVTNGTPAFSYDWSPGTANTQNLNNVQAGTYTVTVTDDDGCEQTGSATIEEPAPLVASADITDVSCFGQSNGSIDLDVSGGTPVYQFEWSNTDFTEDVIDLEDGTYAVTITDNNGCTEVETFDVFQPNPLVVTASDDETIAQGQSAELEVINVTGGTGNVDYLWTPDAPLDVASGSVVNASPNEDTEFLVTAVDDNGCVTTDTVVIYVDVNLYYFPDGFTPNNDGSNDVYDVLTSVTVDITDFKVFNRWGKLVYDADDDGWDGTYDGEPQPMDTYMYQATITLPDGEETVETGSFILIR